MKSLKYNIISEPKFKDVLLDIRILVSLNKENATKISLLTKIFSDRCQKYSSKQKMNEVLDNLYGASLSSKPISSGRMNILSIRMHTLNEKYTEKGQLKKSLLFLREILYNPLICEETVKEAKKNLKEHIIHVLDNPKDSALKEAFQLAAPNDPLAISSLGELDLLEDISVNDLLETYHYLMKEGDFIISCIGDIKEKEVKKQMIRVFGKEIENNPYNIAYCIQNKEGLKRVKKKTEQSQIVMVYPTNINIKDSKFWALKLGCIILGQLPVSLLFSEVREKRSLCYSISSTILGFDGALVIQTGVQKKNIDETILLSKKQVERIQSGDFDDELLETAKIMIINSYRSSLDDITTVFSNSFKNILINEFEDEETFARLIKKVSKEEIIEVMKNCICPTIYIQEGEDNE